MISTAAAALPNRSGRPRVVLRNTLERAPDSAPGSRQIVPILQIKPELRFDAKVTTKPQRRIRGDAQLLASYPLNARARHAARFCHRIRR